MRLEFKVALKRTRHVYYLIVSELLPFGFRLIFVSVELCH